MSTLYVLNEIGRPVGTVYSGVIAAEVAAGVVPTNYSYEADAPVIDPRRYGFAADATAETNSTALQNASEVAWRAGGGEILVPAGVFDIDTPVRIFEQVSIRGAGKNATFLRKTTATPSPVEDDSVRFWDSAVVGFPVCVLQFVAHNGTGTWAYASCRDISVKSSTENPNTTALEYGFLFHGAIGCSVEDCYASFCEVGFFFGGNSTITSEIRGNVAAEVQRGFYQHFMTSTSYHHNYANDFRYAGHCLRRGFYSEIFANASDNGGTTWKVGTTEIALAYEFVNLTNCVVSANGTESCNGSAYKISNCLSSRFTSNFALDYTSSYTGANDVCLWEHDSNNSCVYEDSRLETSGMTGTGARHFMYKITTELGNYVWERNRFVDGITDTTNTSTWANTSGTIVETASVTYVAPTSFTPTIIGTGTAGAGTYTNQSGTYERKGNEISFRLRVSWSAHTGVGNIRVGGLPLAAANTEGVPCMVVAENLTFSGQLVGLVNQNATTIDVYVATTGAVLTPVALDTAATLWIQGNYLTA